MSADPTHAIDEPVLPVPDVRPTRTRSRGGLDLLLALAVAVAIGGVAFAVGRGTAPVVAAARLPGPNVGNGAVPGASFAPGASGVPGSGNGGGQGGAGRGFGRGGFAITGTVQSVSGDILTIETADGSTIEVSTDTGTTYHTQADASASDVASGATVSIRLAGGGFGQGQAGSGTDPLGTASDITVIP